MSPVFNQKRGNGGDGSAKVVVAVKASKDISRNGFVWALSHIVQPGDCVTLLVVVPNHASGRKIWGLPILSRDCTNGHRRLRYGTTLDHKSDIVDYCSKMMVQLLKLYDPTNIKIKIKIVSASLCGSVAAESKKAKADWVVLDKHLKHEEKKCIEELRCNIVVMKQNQAKIIRLNLVGSSEAESQLFPTLPPELDKPFHQIPNHVSDASVSNHVMTMISYSSSDLGTLFTSTEPVSSSDAGTSPRSIPEANDMFKKQEALVVREDKNFAVTCSDSDSDTLSPSTALEFQPWVAEILRAACSSSKQADKFLRRLDDKAYNATAKELLDKFSELDMDARISSLNSIRNVREATASSRAKPSTSPSLCSVCLHKAPLFGKPPRWFSYAELVHATGGFSQANFLAEGGFGSVHRGVLSDGLVVAVKQHKLASSQGDVEFCSEVEVLSCAQHRNVVMLIGFCVEDKRRLLVYEYICNGSLDSHLYGRNGDILEWSSRLNIAVGAARGLRYLHAECRVGCIVHRDMRPNNVLLTHDFEPLVGDFGLARWQPDGDLGVETRVIGTLGYLAPEYAQSGQITEKADVYSFGVVLLELVTGRKAVDINKPKGQQCLTEWARPLLKQCAIDKLVDPRLENHYSKREVYCMLNAASSCIRRDPHVRPRMSHVLRMLEGDIIVESNCSSLQRGEAGNRSDRLLIDLKQQHRPKDTMRTAYRRDRARRASYGGA